MERDHLPSSPLHHRPTSRDSNGAPNEDANNESIKLPDPRAGPSTTSPQVPTATLNWQQDPNVSLAATPESSWQATTPTCPWPEEPVASSSTTRPLSPTRPTPIARPPPIHLPVPPRHHIPSLLTSQPLDRCASTTGTSPRPRPHRSTPCPHTPPRKIIGKRRYRSSSLPPSIPDYKRRKGYSPNQPPPSEAYGRTLVPIRKRATRLEIQQARADIWAREYRRRPFSEVQTFVAARSPPINLSSLKTLDAHEILKSAQLRHDLIFDNVAFRPVNSPYPPSMLSTPPHALLPPSHTKGDINGAQAAEMYWEAIEVEILTGCRCMRWKVDVIHPVEGKEVTHGLEGRRKEDECVCEGRSLALTDAEWWELQRATAWPSRIPELIQTLKEILLSLMGSTTPCPNHFSYSFSQEALLAHEATCPTVTHALVPQLSAALDPEFITLQIRRGVMSMNIFNLIGEAMKVHCAPLRDSMVDDMAVTAARAQHSTADIVLALRKCFACVEVMKLDIANHQVHALRPYLTNHSFSHEVTSFKSYLVDRGLTIETSKTRHWIHTASREVLRATSPIGRKHMIGQCLCRNNAEWVIRSMANGLVALAFDAKWMEVGTWPPAGVFEKSLVLPSLDSAPCAVDIPESLRMDVRRLRSYHADAVEITIIQLLLLACRSVWTSLYPNGTLSSLKDAMLQLSIDLTEVHEPSSIREAINYHSDLRENSSTAVCLAHRIIELGETDSHLLSNADRQVTLDEIATTIDIFIATNLRPNSPLFVDNTARLQGVIAQQLTHEMLVIAHDPHSARYRPSLKVLCGYTSPFEAEIADKVAGLSDHARESEGARARRRFEIIQSQFAEEQTSELRKHGMEPLRPAIRKLVERMSVLANFNVGVFGNYYRRKGMIVGA